MNIFDRQRTPGTASGVLRVAGIDGLDLDVAQAIQTPQVPEVPNVSGEFFARASNSINASINAQQQLIATRSANAAATAQAESQSTNRSTIAEVVGGLSAGLELFGQIQQQKQSQQQEIDTALFERRIREQVVDMNALIGENAHNSGFIPTQRIAFQEIDRNFAHLPIGVRQEVFSIAQSALNDAQKQQSARRISTLGETADTIRENRRQKLFLLVNARLEKLRLNDETATINTTMDEILNDAESYLSSIGATGSEAISLMTTIYEEINSSLSDNFNNTGETERRVATFNELANRSQQIVQETQGNPRMRELLLGQLDAEAGGALPGVSFRNLIPSNSNIIEGFIREQESIQALDDYRSRNLWQTHEANAATNFYTGSLIFNINRGDPQANFTRQAVREGQESNPTIRNAVALADEFQANIQDFNRLSQEFLQAQVGIAENESFIASIATKLDPTATLGPPVATDVFVQNLVQLAGRERGRISPEEATRLNELFETRIGTFQNQRQSLRQQLNSLVTKWQQYGLRVDDPTNNEALTNLGAQARPLIEQAEREFQQRRSTIPPGQGGPPNFSTGSMVTTPPIVPLHQTTEGLTLPFQQGNDASSVQVTSRYGLRTNPVNGRAQFHSGTDFDSINGDENIRAVAGGEVLHAGEWSGFGGTITVRTDSGHIEQYSHLRRLDVSPGDRIPPGTIIGLMGGGDGDEMAGRSTDRHLHFTVYPPGIDPSKVGRPPYDGTTVDPEDYLLRLNSARQLPTGAGLPPTQAHPGSDQVSFGNTWIDEVYNNYRRTRSLGGGSVFSGDLTVATSPDVFNNSNPQPQRRASITRAPYPTVNDPKHNYGYGVLRDDPRLARALAQTSNNLDIPAQWLADVIAYESGFNPAITNGEGAVGLIQFYPGGGLRLVANELGVSEAQAANSLRQMPAHEQMRFVESYLRPYQDRINTVEDLLAVVFGGPDLLNQTPRQRQRTRDSNISFGEYLTRLGRDVGRRYQTSYDRRRAAAHRIHDSFSSDCPRCHQMLANLGRIVPHEG